MHYVYKYVYDDEIIYIGKTDTSLNKRISQHGRCGDNISKKYWEEINNSKIYYCKANNRYMTDVIESEMIRRYKPKCNKAKKSNWSGLEFVEPEWYFYDKDLYKEKIVYKQKVVTENYPYKKEMFDFYKKEYYVNKNKIKALEKEIEELSFYKYCKEIRANEVHKMMIDKDEVKSISDKYLTYGQITGIYRNTNKKINYESKAYDEEGNLIVHKIIYTDEYDHLKYDFEQSYKNRKNGDIILLTGTIYDSRQDKTMKKYIYNLLRVWDRVGNSFYKKINL